MYVDSGWLSVYRLFADHLPAYAGAPAIKKIFCSHWSHQQLKISLTIYDFSYGLA